MAAVYSTIHGTTPPMDLNQLLGYFTCSVIRDSLGQFLDYIESEAAMAPNIEET
jgi:hypothetical protein